MAQSLAGTSLRLVSQEVRKSGSQEAAEEVGTNHIAQTYGACQRHSLVAKSIEQRSLLIFCCRLVD